MKTLNFKHLFFGSFVILMIVCAGMSVAYGQTNPGKQDGWATYEVSSLKLEVVKIKESWVIQIDSLKIIDVEADSLSDIEVKLINLINYSNHLVVEINYKKRTATFKGHGKLVGSILWGIEGYDTLMDCAGNEMEGRVIGIDDGEGGFFALYNYIGFPTDEHICQTLHGIIALSIGGGGHITVYGSQI